MSCLIVKGTPLKNEMFCRKWCKIHAHKKVLAKKSPTYLPPQSKLSYPREQVPIQHQQPNHRTLNKKHHQTASWNPKLFAKRQPKKVEPLQRLYTAKSKIILFNFLKSKFQSQNVINGHTLENFENWWGNSPICLEF